MADTDSLVDQHGQDIVDQAFALQAHIREHGIEGVHFIAQARQATHGRKEAVAREKMAEHVPHHP